MGATGVDSTGCTYGVTASGPLVLGAMFGLGYASGATQFSDVSARCRWPVSLGHQTANFSIVGVGAGVGSGSIPAWFATATVGSLPLIHFPPLDVGVIGLFFAGGGIQGHTTTVQYADQCPP